MFEDDSWKWRIYLPTTGNCTLNAYSGHSPSPAGRHDADWYRVLHKNGVGMGSSIVDGEFTLEARAVKDGKNWVLTTKSLQHTGKLSRTGGGKTSIWQPSGDWLSDRRARYSSSDVTNVQKDFTPGAPILLILCQRPIITDQPGGYTSESPAGPADGFAVWLEPTPPATAAKSAKP